MLTELFFFILVEYNAYIYIITSRVIRIIIKIIIIIIFIKLKMFTLDLNNCLRKSTMLINDDTCIINK